MSTLKHSAIYTLLSLTIISTASIAQNQHFFKGHIPAEHLNSHAHERQARNNYRHPKRLTHSTYYSKAHIRGLPPKNKHRRNRHSHKHHEYRVKNHHHHNVTAYRPSYWVNHMNRRQTAYNRPLTIYLNF